MLAIVAVIGMVLTHSGDPRWPWLLPVTAALIAIEGAMAVRVVKARGHSESQGHEEALFVFMAIAFSPIAALVVVVAGAIVGNLLARRERLKAVFNIASFTASAALALTVMNLIAGSSGMTSRRALAVLVAATVFSAGTRAAVSGVLSIMFRGSFVDDFLDDLRPAALLFAGDVSVGFLAGLAAANNAWSIPFAFAAMVALNFAYSGHAHARRQTQTVSDLVSSSQDGIFLVDGNGLVQLWNPAMTRLTGRTYDEVAGTQPANVLDLRDAEGNGASGVLTPEAVESSEDDLLENVLQLQSPSGTRWLRLSRSPLPESGYSFIVRDISAEHRAGEELRRNEERLRLALEAGSMGWWEWNPVSGEERWSDGLEATFGISPGESGVRYEDFLACVHPDDRDAVAQASERALREGTFAMAYRILHPDDTIRWIEGSGRLIQTSTGPRMFGVSRDITERKAMEAHLLHAQKVEAVGQLAAGIAHDFNNMMTAVNGHSEMTLNKLGHDDPARANVEQIAAAGKRAASLSAQLLTFTRRPAFELAAVNLSHVLIGIQDILPTLLPAGVELTIEADADLGSIRGDAGELEQAIVNLAINAGHAMPLGGELHIEMTNSDMSATEASAAGIAKTHCVRLAVTDTGIGMDDETRARIFEPFFTTKARGEGTGLGLSTIVAIVQRSGGTISVSSAPGAGTTFELLFPRIDTVSESREDVSVSLASPSTTILLADDSQAIRTFERLILEEAGYLVLEAASAPEALTIAETYKGPIHVLLTDVAMPDGSGATLACQLQLSRPGMAVIFVSGLTRDELDRYALPSDATCFTKPVTRDFLLEAVRDKLMGSAASDAPPLAAMRDVTPERHLH